MKRWLVFLLVLALLPAIPVFAAEASGTCGLNVNWIFDEQSGVLTIFGNGVIDDADYDKAPWEAFRERIAAVKVEKGILKVGEYAFYGLPNLVEVSLPEGLETVGTGAFGQCPSLTKIEFPDTVWAWGNMVLQGCTALTQVKLPKGIVQIPVGIFKDCVSLKEFVIPDTVAQICDAAFENSGLVGITVPGSVKIVGAQTFKKCDYLNSVVLCDGVQELGFEAFDYCPALKELTIPASVNTMVFALRNNYDLEKITFQGNLPAGADRMPENRPITLYYPLNTKTWTQAVLDGYSDNVTCVGFDKEGTQNPILATGTCGQGITWVLNDDYALTISGSGEIKGHILDCWKGYEKSIRKIVIEDGITEIGSSAFYGFTALEEVTIADTVTQIGDSAFYGCKKLTYVKIPAGVQNISMRAFGFCESLQQVDIMSADTKFTLNSAFGDCPMLGQVNVLGTTPTEPVPTEPTEGEPSQEVPLMALFISIVITVAVLVAGAAAVMVIMIKKRE